MNISQGSLQVTPLPIHKDGPEVMKNITLNKAIYFTQPYTDTKQICIPIVPTTLYNEREFSNGDLFNENIGEEKIENKIQYTTLNESWIFNLTQEAFDKHRDERLTKPVCEYCSVLTTTKTPTFKQYIQGYNPDNNGSNYLNVTESTWAEKENQHWQQSGEIPICSYCLSEIVNTVYSYLNSNEDLRLKYLLENIE